MYIQSVNYGEQVMSKGENKAKSLEARTKILEVLFDGKWHQTKDLKVETKVSSKTLYKHLDALANFIEKRVEPKENLPKAPVYYRATPTLLALKFESELTAASMKDIIKNLSNPKELVPFLKVINMLNNFQILVVLETIQKSNLKFSDTKQISFLMRSFVLTPFEHQMAALVKATSKIIDSIDFDQVRKDLKEN